LAPAAYANYLSLALAESASIAETRELARHKDVKMTMRYTHIGLEDPARALAALPNPYQLRWADDFRVNSCPRDLAHFRWR
jgi:hypothetical protein